MQNVLDDTCLSHTIHVWYIYIPTIWLIFMVSVGKYTSPMDPVGYQKRS